MSLRNSRWMVPLLIVLELLLTVTLPLYTRAAPKSQDMEVTLKNLRLSAPSAREAVLTFRWGAGAQELGLGMPKGEGMPLGPSSFDVSHDGQVAIADAANHRIQVFDRSGQLLHSIENIPMIVWGIRLTSKGVAALGFDNRDVIEYALDGRMLGRAPLPKDVEWATELFELDEVLYVESDDRLVPIALPHRPSVAQNERRPGRPVWSRPGQFAAFGDQEDGETAVRYVLQGRQTEQLKIRMADRRILQILEHHTDKAGNLYLVAYLNDSLQESLDVEGNVVAVLKLNPAGRLAQAVVLSGEKPFFTVQQRRFVATPQGQLYQFEATRDGATLYRLKFRALADTQYRDARFDELPNGMFVPAPSHPNTDPPRKPEPRNARLVDHHQQSPSEGEVGTTGHSSGPYSGAPPMTRDTIIEIAQSAVDSPYDWGDERWSLYDRNWEGADCSGLVSTAWQVYHARPPTEEASRPSTWNLKYEDTHWFAVDVSQRQKGDAFVQHHECSGCTQHTFLYEADGGSGLVWVYEALTFDVPIRHVKRDFVGFELRRRKNLDTTGIAGRDKGWIFEDFQHTYWNYGGEGSVGHPFDNGGTYFVHRWLVNGEDGYVQDFRGGSRGTSIIMHGDGRPGAFLVSGGIYNLYMSMGGPGSWLGWPTSQEHTASNGCWNAPRQNFAGGYIIQDCDGVFRAYGY